MSQFAHQSRRSFRCPRCSSGRPWKLRDQARKCKRCRYEWTPRWRVPGFHAPPAQWQRVLSVFLRDRTAVRVAEHVGLERRTVHRMLLYVRAVMLTDLPPLFRGIVEADETYVGGTWANKRRLLRRTQKTGEGHGTLKQAILAVLHRRSSQVRVFFLPPRWTSADIISCLREAVAPGTRVYTDGYHPYRPVGRAGFRHAYVNHHKGEFIRGVVHTNTTEGFFGYLKRYLKKTGGIRKSRLPLYVGELVWRYNHRKLRTDEQMGLLYQRLVGEK